MTVRNIGKTSTLVVFSSLYFFTVFYSNYFKVHLTPKMFFRLNRFCYHLEHFFAKIECCGWSRNMLSFFFPLTQCPLPFSAPIFHRAKGRAFKDTRKHVRTLYGYFLKLVFKVHCIMGCKYLVPCKPFKYSESTGSCNGST